MEMLRSLRGDKHEFCLTVIKFKHVRSCPSFGQLLEPNPSMLSSVALCLFAVDYYKAAKLFLSLLLLYYIYNIYVLYTYCW